VCEISESNKFTVKSFLPKPLISIITTTTAAMTTMSSRETFSVRFSVRMRNIKTATLQYCSSDVSRMKAALCKLHDYYATEGSAGKCFMRQLTTTGSFSMMTPFAESFTAKVPLIKVLLS